MVKKERLYNVRHRGKVVARNLPFKLAKRKMDSYKRGVVSMTATDIDRK